MSRAFSAQRIFFANLDLGLRALRFTPGCHITGFQPGECPNFIGRLEAAPPERRYPCRYLFSVVAARGTERGLQSAGV